MRGWKLIIFPFPQHNVKTSCQAEVKSIKSVCPNYISPHHTSISMSQNIFRSNILHWIWIYLWRHYAPNILQINKQKIFATSLSHWSLQLPAELIIRQTNWISLSHIKWKSLITYNCVSPHLKLKQIISDY